MSVIHQFHTLRGLRDDSRAEGAGRSRDVRPLRLLRLLWHPRPRHLVLLAMLCGAAIAAAACSDDDTKSPTAPTGIPNVAGTWAGQYHIKNCTDTVNGAPGTLCASVTDSSTA